VRDRYVKTPKFGLFDHIEEIPGTPPAQLFKERLELIRAADQAGFESFHMAEHHGTDLCMAPNQEVFIAAASQITENIRMGPMVKLLPMHNPIRVLEDMVVLDHLTEGRLDYGVGRGAVPAEHAWHGSSHRDARERFADALAIIARALKTGEVTSEGSVYSDFPPMPLYTKPYQENIPFWYPGNPATAGRYGMSLMMAGPMTQEVYDTYIENWEKYKDDPVRLDGPNSEPTVGSTLVVAIAEDEKEAIRVARAGTEGLSRRTFDAHRFDGLVIDEAERDEVLAPLKFIQKGLEASVGFGAGTPSQIAERMAGLLEPGLIDLVVLMLPTGDMTMAESRRTLDLFVTEVKPQLEMQPA
jgi:alkanesulfonate monooxygenase SsuD/methylene tetrahydromethanopterin reductase-like flavin-dependent oxidoreductase (luciferase family)